MHPFSCRFPRRHSRLLPKERRETTSTAIPCSKDFPMHAILRNTVGRSLAAKLAVLRITVPIDSQKPECALT